MPVTKVELPLHTHTIRATRTRGKRSFYVTSMLRGEMWTGTEQEAKEAATELNHTNIGCDEDSLIHTTYEAVPIPT